MIDLAYVLGQSHALRRLCGDRNDLYWRQRMLRMIEVETPDQDFTGRLTVSFNDGFASASQAHARCDAKARADTAAVAAKGRALSSSLAGGTSPPT